MEAVFALLGVALGIAGTYWLNERRMKFEERKDKRQILLAKYEQMNFKLISFYMLSTIVALRKEIVRCIKHFITGIKIIQKPLLLMLWNGGAT